MRQSDIDRFWSFVSTEPHPNGCREWLGSRDQRGYGIFCYAGKRERAHRVGWKIAHPGQEIPPGKHGCHHCDNPPCVWHEHIFIGTQSENLRDCVRKGRHGTRTKPEKIARGDNTGARRYPERLARGDRHGLRLHPESRAVGERVGGAKLKSAQVIEIRRRHAHGERVRDLAPQFGISESTAFRAISGHSWGHLKAAIADNEPTP